MPEGPHVPPPSSAAEASNIFTVQAMESGQKLLQLLQRRLDLPQGLLHRWIRTGQVRLNGGRAKPFAIVAVGDMIRLPPFASGMAGRKKTGEIAPATKVALPPLVGRSGDIWAFNKPSGLPTQPGTGHEDSLAGRLAAFYAGQPYIPTPIHRLDKDTSGILLVAGSFAALSAMTSALRRHELHKEYLAWVAGRWPQTGVRRLTHWLCKTTVGTSERMRVSDTPGEGVEATLTVQPLLCGPDRSLLLVRLHTGRTHQIRAQLAHMGHPVLGDGKYGASGSAPRLMLHALRVILPDGEVFACLPEWREPFAVTDMPPLQEELLPHAAAEDMRERP